MFRCIICFDIFVNALRTEEHVFPDSMGGTLTFKGLCKPCNDRLGEDADAPLADHFWIKVARKRFNIAGRSGVPNPFEKLSILERIRYGGAWHRTQARWDGSYLYRHPSKWPDGQMVYDPSDEERAAKAAETARARRPAAAPPRFRFTERDVHRGVLQFEIERPTEAMRGLVKIAYETTCVLLGHTYLRDASARLIRRFLHSRETNGDKLGVNAAFAAGESLRASSRDHSSELIAGVRSAGGRTLCYVRVFDTFEATIEVAQRAWSGVDTAGVAFVVDVQKPGAPARRLALADVDSKWT